MRFPEWRSLARFEREDGAAPYLVLEVPPPPEADVQHALRIDTSNEEITVGFDFYHSHFDEWVGDGEHFGTKVAVSFIRQVISERVAVVSWWHNQEWRGSAQLEAGKPLEPPSWASSSTYNRIRVRSWCGTLNSDAEA